MATPAVRWPRQPTPAVAEIRRILTDMQRTRPRVVTTPPWSLITTLPGRIIELLGADPVDRVHPFKALHAEVAATLTGPTWADRRHELCGALTALRREAIATAATTKSPDGHREHTYTSLAAKLGVSISTVNTAITTTRKANHTTQPD